MVVHLPRTVRDGRVDSFHESGLGFIWKEIVIQFVFRLRFDYTGCIKKKGNR